MNRQQMLLVIFAEECAEVAQQVSKALRFGIDEQRDLSTGNNRERLLAEFNDLLAVAEMLEEEGISLQRTPGMIFDKKQKVEQYMAYSRDLGILQIKGG